MARDKDQQAIEVKSQDPEITGDAEEDDEEPEAEQKQTLESVQKRLSWAEKKANRYKSAKQEAADSKEKLAAEQRRADMAEMRANQLQTYAQGIQAVMGKQDQPDPLDEKIKDIEKQQERLRMAFPANPTEEDRAKFWKEWRGLEDQRADTRYEKRTRDSTQGVSQGQVEQTAQAAAAGAMLKAKYPDVLNNPQMATYTAHLYNAKLSMGMQGDSALEEAIGETRRAFKLAGSAPSASDRAKYGGPPSGGMANGHQNGGTKLTPDRMTEGQKKLARGAYRNLDPAQAYKRYCKEIDPIDLEDQ